MAQRIIAYMPIKLNNQRCPGKNLRLLGGRPLIQHMLQSLSDANGINEIIVYCSDDSVKEYLLPNIAFQKRPSWLDSDDALFGEIFGEFIKTTDSDIYIVAHATAPYIKKETINACLSAVTSGEYDSAFVAEELQDFLWQNGTPMNFDPKHIPVTQDLIPVYKETTGLYVFRKSVFVDSHQRIGKNPYIQTASLKEAVDINTEEDFRIAEALYSVQLD